MIVHNSEPGSGIQNRWVQETLTSEDATGLLITHLPHIRWACGFTGSNGFLLVRDDELHLFTDRRYETQVTLEVQQAQIHIGSRDLVNHAINKGLVNTTDRLLIQPEYMTLAEFTHWETLLPGISLFLRKNLLNSHVAVKSEDAIARMQQAQLISDSVFKEVCELITPGIRENELAAKIDYHHMIRGASRMAFETIVAFGANSALPHARPSNQKLRIGDPVLLDFGCIFNGYASDMTRTLYCGVPGGEFRTAYKAVQEAQDQAIQVAHDGIKTSEVDQAARSILTSKGLGEFFSHSTGHGIGLEVHEWPRISANSSATLLKGHTVTIEPGVYLPDKFGIRIEDTVVIGSSACERLSHIERDLITI
ncbi:MAG: aminopeptidase P family protein [Rhodothermaceae bacterium]|nr:aminopeptidase P family protein [Rhodothermaceae bacterium]MYG68722.1 aminopeptidase P family protein [Rhodothermaceae bacterium]MYJ45511.1 aminopeptidase P family protein [Rhodothermaceae bacterium]